MLVKTKTPIRKFGGKIVGWIEEDNDGNQQVKDFYGRILGFYNKKENKTRNFYKKIIGDGNLLMTFLSKDLI